MQPRGFLSRLSAPTPAAGPLADDSLRAHLCALLNARQLSKRGPGEACEIHAQELSHEFPRALPMLAHRIKTLVSQQETRLERVQVRAQALAHEPGVHVELHAWRRAPASQPFHFSATLTPLGRFEISAPRV